ncbi:MAG TPA: ATP-binding cassette domain-containing protein [Herpetosiphonaceae bacterium]|nr:ATP-binding cassette domain-containing protein [Herpetosiphonaceae bacterium]
MLLNKSTPKTGAGKEPLLRVEHLSKHFFLGRTKFTAVDDVSIEVESGQTLGIVGESGCGKSTLSRSIIRLYEPDAGKVYFDGVDFTALSLSALREKRKDIQMIFQDPLASLNPMMTVAGAIEDPMIIHKVGTSAERARRVHELLEVVGLDPGAANAFPFEFSGGQQQRIGIARALALNPKLLICDEAVSALDVSIQAQILRLLQDLQEQLGLAYLFISHNLAVVEHMSDCIAVMSQGKVVEYSETEALFQSPREEYTRTLINSVPYIPRPGGKSVRQPKVGDATVGAHVEAASTLKAVTS